MAASLPDRVAGMRVTILGGGGFRVPLICRELARSGLAVDEVVLFDVVPGRLGVIAGVLAGDHLPLRTTTDLDTALRGADLIFAALRVGGLDGRVRDERAALDLGVLGQETVGAGGLAYAARAVPVVDAIARRIAELASQAWVISMTNPAGIVTEVMAATLGNRVIGVCDSPMALVRRACAAAGVDPGPSLARLAARPEGRRHRPAAWPAGGSGPGARDGGRAAVRRRPAAGARRDPQRVPVLVLRSGRGSAGRPGGAADPRRARP